MSKIKDALIRAKEIKEYYEWGYMEHLYANMPKQELLSESDIKKMESSYANSSKPLLKNSSEIVSINSSNTAKAIKDAAWEQIWWNQMQKE